MRMGTKGYFAIIYKGKMYLSYNQFDAYPEKPGVGWTLVNEIRWGNLETWKWAIDNIKIPKGAPTEEDKKNLCKFADLTVNSQSDTDWYCLTRKCQGSIVRTLQSGYFTGSITPFKEEDLVERLSQHQWGYAVDLDKNEFRTFQTAEIHFWRFQLDAIPLGTFGEASILAFNRIADGDEFRYHDSGDAVIEAYKRFFQEEQEKEEEEKKRLPKSKADNTATENEEDNKKRPNESESDKPDAAKIPKHESNE